MGYTIIEIVEDLEHESVEKDTFHKDLTKGISIKKDPKTLYFTPKSFSRTFTPERIKLMLLIKKRRFDSISELAKGLSRPFESVHRDIKYLEGMHLMKLNKYNKMMKPVSLKISFLF